MQSGTLRLSHAFGLQSASSSVSALRLCIPLLLGMLATEHVSAACRPVSGDIWIDRQFDVAFTEAPDRRLASASGRLVMLCDPADTRLELRPQFSGLRYAREIPVYEHVVAGYEINATSPLLAFTIISLGSCDEHAADCKQIELPEGDDGLRDGQVRAFNLSEGNRKEIALSIAAYSRGGPMNDLPTTFAGSVTSLFGGSGGAHQFNIGFYFLPQTCRVGARDIVLDDVAAEALDAHHVAGRKAFDIAVDCGAQARELTLMLTDANDAGSTHDWLSAASGSSAQGVALQVLHQGQPVLMSQAWRYGDTGSGSVSVPFSAQYLRTSGPLLPGLIRGEAVLTADYR